MKLRQKVPPFPWKGGCPKGRGGPVKNDEKPANLIPVLLKSTKSLATTYSKE